MEQKQPLVSIIIPVYNTSKYLPRTLESLHSQTYANFEAICVNDGSTDNCLQIMQEMAAKDQRFVILSQKNKGIAATRNRGLQAAHGLYIMFLDGDDYFHPQCVELAVKAITSLQTDICQFDFRSVDVDEIPVSKKYNQLPKCNVYTQPLYNFLRKRLPKSVLVWDKIYKAEIAKQVLFRNVRPGEDDLYSFETMAKANTMGFMKATLQYYVRVPTSVMHSMQTAEYQQNRLKVAAEFGQITTELVSQLQHNKSLPAMLYKYYHERFLFKEFILKPQRLNSDKAELTDNVKFLQQKILRGEMNCAYLRPRFRLIFWLLQHRLYFLARIATG